MRLSVKQIILFETPLLKPTYIMEVVSMTKYTRDELIRALDLTVFQKGTTQYSHQISSLKKTLPKYGLELVEVEKKCFELYTADSKIDYEDLFTREELGKFANRVISPNKSFE